MADQTGAQTGKKSGAQTEKQSGEQAGNAGLDRSLRQLTGYVLRRASHLMQGNAAEVLKPHGLRITTFSALSVICEHPGVTLSQIAASLQMERSNTVQVIDALLSAGLIDKQRLASDRRAFALQATPGGHQRCNEATSALIASEEAKLQQLSPSEQDMLRQMLQRLLR